MSNKFQFDCKWMVDENWNNQSVSNFAPQKPIGGIIVEAWHPN